MGISLKKYGKNISKVNGNFEYTENNKQIWFNFYYDYFLNLICNMYEWENLPNTIDPIFLEKNLNIEGFLGFILDDDLGYFVQRGTLGNKLDIYDQPESFYIVNNNNWLFKKRKYYINHYYNEVDFNKTKKCVLINNNFFRESTTNWIIVFCSKLADIEQSIQLNRNAQNMPFVFLTNDDNRLTMKQLYNRMMEQEPVIYLKEQKNKDGIVENLQISDRVKVLNTNTPFLLDKLHDEKQRVINQFLTFIGINNNAVDKAERLVSAEATANNGLINASIEMRLKARKKSCELINKIYDLNIKVDLSNQIEKFNTEQIYEDLTTYPEEINMV